ncbi:hypothetical protein [Spirosoma oryzae]|uniref:hypothetical protein n=1 Tax=Spirosoma oryzae TaxID=1469603 RepID=UPI000D06CB6B|nr:hypothetical protein [Spirosoma oryzae]
MNQQFAAVDQLNADGQLKAWIDKMNFNEPVETTCETEPLPEAIAFYQTGSAEMNDEGDPICGDWRKWHLLTMQHLRCIDVEKQRKAVRLI